MHPSTVDRDSRLSFWQRVRRFAVPPDMIEVATARRALGDWAGACAAARVDVDLRTRSVARTYGHELAARLRADLKHLAPDLLRWHLPRVAPDGLLRPGLTISLARYSGSDGGTPHLVVRTPPAWADAGQRISLGLWDPYRPTERPHLHPHPHPDRRFRLDLHRHLWDARRAAELRVRSGVDRQTGPGPDGPDRVVPDGFDCAVPCWAAELALLLEAEGRTGRSATVRLGSRHRLLLELVPDQRGGPAGLRIRPGPARSSTPELPVLPDAATWVPPDLALLRAGLIEPDHLHPLVASALVPDRAGDGSDAISPATGTDSGAISPTTGDGSGAISPAIGAGPAPPGRPVRFVDCRGARHRIGVLAGTLVALDHDPAEIRREELLATLGGTPLPCFQVIDATHRQPGELGEIRARLAHGDAGGAVAAVERLIGADAQLRGGELRDELATAALRQVSHGLYRAGLGGYAPHPASGLAGHARDLSRQAALAPRVSSRARPRHANTR